MAVYDITRLAGVSSIQFRISLIKYAISGWILNIIVSKFVCLVCDTRTTIPLFY